ncbi:MAG: type II toxin-antitoxin system RelE/ParE family toxin [Deltaproteobacteria bacterium]|nr:type II toxin-antitoxin system RelE/ParE family toxin [Deltaproteobacteria bacterium]
MFRIEWEPRAVEELSRIRAFDRARILGAVSAHLTEQANVVAGHRKQVFDLRAPWSEGHEPFWQLKVEPYRVFYDVLPSPQGARAEGLVMIRAVRRKPPGKRTEEIL